MVRPGRQEKSGEGGDGHARRAVNAPGFPDPAPPVRAGVNFGGIADAGDPVVRRPVAGRVTPSADGLPVEAAPIRALPSPLIPAAPFNKPPRNRLGGLRLLPLESFFWGNTGSAPRPRVRGDHTLLWLTEGGMRLGLPRNDRRFGPGWLWFLPHGTAFSALPLADARGYALLVPPTLAQARLPQRIICAEVGPHEAGLTAVLSGLAAEATASGPQAEAALALHLDLLAIQLSRIAAVRPSGVRPGGETRARDGERELVNHYLELCDREMGRGRTVAELAQMLGVPAGLLDGACRRLRGKTALTLLYDQRHRAAVRLLRDTRLPVAQIADDLGYTSMSHFIRAFSRATGRSPEGFRAPSDEAF